MNTTFMGKKLLVIGGTSGMGLATAKRVVENGGSVVLVGNRREKAEQARQALATYGKGGYSRGRPDERGRYAAGHGEHQCRASGYQPAGQRCRRLLPEAVEHGLADYDRYMNLNRATFFITREVVRNMLVNGIKGSIVNIGSMWAQQAIGATPSSAYSMAKAGLHALTKNLAIRAGR